jgi:hypothetical protein
VFQAIWSFLHFFFVFGTFHKLSEANGLANDRQGVNLSRRILEFHERNYGQPQTHQTILNPKSFYFQYSRLFAVLKEIQNFNFESFLDVGCAEGMYLVAVKKRKPQCSAYGVDFSLASVKKAQVYTNQSGSYLIRTDASNLPFINRPFDVVLCSETLEHIVEDKKAMKELARVCGKLCLITVPSFHSQRSESRFKPDVNCERDSHLRKYSRNELRGTLGMFFEDVRIFDLSLWHLSSVAIIIHAFLPRPVSAKISVFFSVFAGLDYRLCKSGAHGHSFICICLK